MLVMCSHDGNKFIDCDESQLETVARRVEIFISPTFNVSAMKLHENVTNQLLMGRIELNYTPRDRRKL